MPEDKIEEGVNSRLENFNSKTKAKTRMVVIGSNKGKHILLLLCFCFRSSKENLSNFKGSYELRGGKVGMGRKEVAEFHGQEQEWSPEAMAVGGGEDGAGGEERCSDQIITGIAN